MRLIEALHRRLLLTATVAYAPSTGLPISYSWNTVVDGGSVTDADVAERSLLKATQTASTNDLFLRLDGIAGSSTASNHVGEITVHSFEWGGDRSPDFPNAGPFFSEMHIVANTTQGSALLVDRLASAQVIPTADLTARYRTGTQVEFLQIELSDVRISSYFVTSGNGTLREEFTLKFDRAEARYFPVVGGVAQTPDTFSWDINATSGTMSDLAIEPSRPMVGNITPFASTQNMYLRLDGVTGEATATGFVNQIDIGGFEWQMDRTATSLQNGISFGTIRLVGKSSSVTPRLLNRMTGGQLSPTATLTIRQTGATPVELYKLDLNSLTVRSLRTTSVNGVALDEFSLSFASFNLTTGANSTTQSLITLGATAQTDRLAQRDIGRLTTMTPSNALFLDLPGVTGASTDANHLNEIELLSYELDMYRGGTFSTLGYGELHIAARSSKATPVLASRMALKTLLTTGTLTVRSSAALGSIEFQVIDLSNARVSSLQTSTVRAGELVDELTLSFQSATFTNRQILPGGTAGTPVTATFSAPSQEAFELTQRNLLTQGMASADQSIFLQLNGINGESVVNGHANEIDVDNFEWQMDSVSAAAPVYYELHVTSLISTATVPIIQRLTTATSISSGRVTVQSAIGFPAFDQYVLNLTNLRVGSYRVRTAADGKQQEEITFTFGSFNLGFRQQSADPLVTFNSTSATAGTTPDFVPTQDSLVQQTAPANSNMLLAMSGINGDVNDITYPNSTNLRAFQWSLNITGNGIQIGELQVTTPVSRSSVPVIDRMTNATSLATTTLAVRRNITATTVVEYFRLSLTNARVSQHTFSSGSGALIDEYSFRFSSLTTRYVPVVNGTPQTAITNTFNTQASGTFVEFDPPARDLARLGQLTPPTGNSMFLRLDGIVGESSAPSFVSNIEILSFDWKANVTISPTSGATSLPEFSELRFATKISKGGMPLLQRLANGQMFPTGTFSVRNNGTSSTFFTVNFDKYMVSTYQLLDAGNGAMIEEFTLHYDISPDTTVPHLLSTSFEFETRQAMNFNFDEQVGGSLQPGDFNVFNISTGQVIQASEMAVSYNFQLKRATLTFPNVAGGILPDGIYGVTIVAGGITDIYGNALATPPTSSFYVLAGDANRDNRVDFDDLLILSQNYGQSGRTFSQGNINYSSGGVVGFDDLLLLAQQYGKSILSAERTGSSKRVSPILSDVLA